MKFHAARTSEARPRRSPAGSVGIDVVCVEILPICILVIAAMMSSFSVGAQSRSQTYFVGQDGIPILTTRPHAYRNKSGYVEKKINFDPAPFEPEAEYLPEETAKFMVHFKSGATQPADTVKEEELFYALEYSGRRYLVRKSHVEKIETLSFTTVPAESGDSATARTESPEKDYQTPPRIAPSADSSSQSPPDMARANGYSSGVDGHWKGSASDGPDHRQGTDEWKVQSWEPNHPTTAYPTPPEESQKKWGVLVLIIACMGGVFWITHMLSKPPSPSAQKQESKTPREEDESVFQRDGEQRESEVRQAEEDTRRATEEARRAEEARFRAQEQAQRSAEEARVRAREEARRAEEARARAEREKTPPVSKDERYYASVLGLSGSVTKDGVRKQFHKRAGQYHPDKVNHLGDKIKKVAEREMKEINEAYEYFKKKYGI